MLFSVFGSLPIVITSSLFSQCASPTDGAFTNRRMTSLSARGKHTLSFSLSLSLSLFLFLCVSFCVFHTLRGWTQVPNEGDVEQWRERK